jgi:hypothetical protein
LGAVNPGYQVVLEWDEMAGELNGLLSGVLNGEYGFVQGMGPGSALGGTLSTPGESNVGGTRQEFFINAADGYYSFWIRDKFADEDINPDFGLISEAEAVVNIYRGSQLVRRLEVPSGAGLTCKVFTLDAANGILDADLRYFPRHRMFVVKLVDAVSGEGIPEAQLSISGGDEHYPPAVTDMDGYAFIAVETGSYRLSVVKEGYINTSFPAEMGFDENPREFVLAMAPKAKEFRIVLTWGARPLDLDAHLAGPHPEGGDFHIWYRNRILISGRDFLDRDDTSSWGPETITIYKPAQGEYHYCVHNYSNRLDRSSRDLSHSGAVVQVYADERLQATYCVPPGRFGNLWDVFVIDKNQRLVELNTIKWTDDESNIR